MNFENTSLYAEAMNIVNNGPQNVHGYCMAVIIINGNVLKPLKVVNVDIVKDFLKSFSAEIMVDLYMSSGTYENDIVPYKENIEMKIYFKPIYENSTANNLDNKIKVIEGRAVLTDPHNNVFSNPTTASSKETRDKMSIDKITFQIVNPMVELFRMTSVGGIYRNVTGADLIKTLYLNVSNSNDIEKQYKVLGVDIADHYNTEIKNHISIPMGTKVIDVPDFIHSQVEGIYPTGMGIYFDQQIWHLYPTFDVDRFNSAKRTLTIIRVPPNVLPLIDRTFINTDKALTILVNKEIQFTDRSDIAQQNLGNGLRFTDGKNIVENFATVVGNKATVSRAKNVSEFVSDKRTTGLNNVTSPGAKISGNMYYEMSKLSKRGGSILDVVWDYCDGSLIHPGMPVRFMMVQGSGVVVVYGIVLGLHEMIALEGSGLNANKHKRQCHLNIFVRRKFNWNEQ